MRATSRKRGPRYRRRTFLQVAGAALAALAVPWRAVAGEEARALRVPARLEPAPGGWVSPPQETRHPFNAIGALWPAGVPASGATLEARTSVDGVEWTPWQPLPLDPDGPDGPHSTLLFVPPSQVVQYRVATPQPAPELVLIDTTAGPDAATLRAQLPAHGVAAPQRATVRLLGASVPARTSGRLPPPRIISRTAWGADETRRWWVPEYHVAEHVALHHTGGATGGADPAAAVRSVYYYHAVILDWGDIGYHFLVDWLGTIYEGRYGGPHVIGGHLRGSNPLVEGIAALGSYDGMWPSDDLLGALVALLAWRAEVLALDPLANTPLGERLVPTLLGHRDAAQTDCPGVRLYASLGTLRRQTADRLGYVPRLAAELLAVAPRWEVVEAGDILSIDLRVRNSGTLPLEPAEREWRGLASQGRLEGSPAPAPPPGAVVLALGTAEEWLAAQQMPPLPTPTDEQGEYGPDAPAPVPPLAQPYRWGLPRLLAPGETATFTVPLRLRQLGTRRLTAAVVRQDGPVLAEQPPAVAVGVRPAPAALRLALAPSAGRLLAPLPPWATSGASSNEAGSATVGLSSEAEAPAEVRWHLDGADSQDETLAVVPQGSARWAVRPAASAPGAQAQAISLPTVLRVEVAAQAAGSVRLPTGGSGVAAAYPLLAPAGGPLWLPLLPPLAATSVRWLLVHSDGDPPAALTVEWWLASGGRDRQRQPLAPGATVRLAVPAGAVLGCVSSKPAAPLVALYLEAPPGDPVCQPLLAAESALLLPIVGMAEGWATELALANVGDTPLEIEARWAGQGEPVTWTERATLAPGATTRWPEGRLVWPFGRFGGLALSASRPSLVATARLVRERDGAVLTLPAVAPRVGLLLLPLADLPGLPEQRRLVLHASTQDATTTVTYRDANGTELARAVERVPAWHTRALPFPEAAGDVATVAIAAQEGAVAAALLQLP